MKINNDYSYVENIRGIDWNTVETIRKYSIQNHKKTNHKYDNKPYSHHLRMVYNYGLKYNYLLDHDELLLALCSCWSHDLIEDCRVSYNKFIDLLFKERFYDMFVELKRL
jgi:hypothetical protein